MRITWLTPELPYWPGGSGGSTRQFQLVRELVRRGHDVDVVAPVHPDQREGAGTLAQAGAELFRVDRPASRVGEVLAAVRTRPAVAVRALTMPVAAWQVEVFWTALRAQAERALARRPDAVLVEHDWAARWARDLPAELPKVSGLENLSWDYYARRAAAAEGLQRDLLRIEAQRFRRFDARTLRAFDLLLAMSELDRHILARVSDRPSAVVPNGVDTGALRAAPLPGTPTVLFTGTFGYAPNAEALRWLLTEIWPRIRARVPAAELLVVGRGVPDEIAALAGEGVTLAGFVPEMQPWFDRAQVVLVPMRSGGGTRLKVLDGLASGRPLVSTTMGAMGVDVTDGQDVLLADGADAFADATARVLGDPALAARLGAAGRGLAERVYDWGAIGGRLEELLRGIVARRR
ncbi:glycosyltransferase family 4 protein [Patulibacter sp. SYSU D01012]|uniref:glycosyltransferase family 4 protein n=1 Tax=Patulibacter sp. SYSU D01012 TaxID=2817381 RepID=UPI001B3140BE|nr:glycosyltransferase family 4 protein [Patulibacter sp. SYSU D01012]